LGYEIKYNKLKVTVKIPENTRLGRQLGKNMAIVTIVGAGMMGSAVAFPAAENGHTVRLVGTHLDRDIIEFCRKIGRHPKFDPYFEGGKAFPKNVTYSITLVSTLP
jgi:glycerol-3-phosphate dehydrogenase